MKRFLLSAYLFHLLSVTSAFSQEIQITAFAPLEQTYGEVFESPELMTMNDMGIDFGYALYETELKTEEENPTLEVENIRDYVNPAKRNVALYKNDTCKYMQKRYV